MKRTDGFGASFIFFCLLVVAAVFIVATGGGGGGGNGTGISSGAGAGSEVSTNPPASGTGDKLAVTGTVMAPGGSTRNR